MAHPAFAMEYPQQSPEEGHMIPNQFYPTHPGQPPMPPPLAFLPNASEPLPNYIGIKLLPALLFDGQQTWEQVTLQRMPESSAKLAEAVKKEASNRRPEEALKNKHLTPTRQQHIYAAVNEYTALEGNSGMVYKLVSIKLNLDKKVEGTAKAMTSKTIVTSIRIIIKRIPRPIILRQSISVPPPTRPMPTGQFPEYQGTPFPIFQPPHIPQHPDPVVHQDARHYPDHGPLFGERPRSPMPGPSQDQLPQGMTRLDNDPEEIDDYNRDGHEDAGYHHKDSKKDKQKQKQKDGKKSKPLEIYIPRDNKRHNSKNSTRPSSLAGSDNYPVFESPLTSPSVTSSFADRHEPRYPAKRYKKYRDERGGESSRRDRRTSHGDFDSGSVTVIPHHTRHTSHGRRYSTTSRNEFARDSPRYPRDLPSYRRERDRELELHDDRGLTSRMDRLRLDELDEPSFRNRLEVEELAQRIEQRNRLQEKRDLEDRLDRLETVVHQNNRDIVQRDRPLLDRRYSGTREIGYSGERRRHPGARYY